MKRVARSVMDADTRNVRLKLKVKMQKSKLQVKSHKFYTFQF